MYFILIVGHVSLLSTAFEIAIRLIRVRKPPLRSFFSLDSSCKTFLAFFFQVALEKVGDHYPIFRHILKYC